MACQIVPSSLQFNQVDPFNAYLQGTVGLDDGSSCTRIGVGFPGFPEIGQITANVQADGTFNAQVKIGGININCGAPVRIKIICLDNDQCTPFEGTIPFNCLPTCPQSAEIRVLSGNMDITNQVLQEAWQTGGIYTIRLIVLPDGVFPETQINWSIQVNGAEINMNNDSRVSNISSDRTSFDFLFVEADNIVEISVSVTINGISPIECTRQDSIHFSASDWVIIVPPPSITDGGDGDDGDGGNGDGGNGDDDDGGNGDGGNGDGGGCGDTIFCHFVGFFLIAVPLSALISQTAFCFDTLLLTLQAIILTAIITAYARGCGACLLWKYLYLGLVLSIFAILIASYWLGFPECLWEAGSVAVAWLATAEAYRYSCNNSNNQGFFDWF